MTELKDWRGTVIKPGQLVVWGSGVGRSIQMNEGVVVGFQHPSGKEYTYRTEVRVLVEVVRRSYSQGEKPVVDIGADRLTIVTDLPPCDLPTQSDHALKSANRLLEILLEGQAKFTAGLEDSYWTSQADGLRYYERRLRETRKKIEKLS